MQLTVMSKVKYYKKMFFHLDAVRLQPLPVLHQPSEVPAAPRGDDARGVAQEEGAAASPATPAGLRS